MPSNGRQTPVEDYIARRRATTWVIVILVLLFLFAFFYHRYFEQTPVDYADINDTFKYGSIGSDSDGGVPYWIWQVLPEMFPQYLPDGDAYLAIPEDERTALDAYRQFGFLVEPGHKLPVGFSERRVTIDRVGLNCAVCHVGALRVSEGLDSTKLYSTTADYHNTDYHNADYRKPDYLNEDSSRLLIMGMPANTVDLEKYFFFLFNSAADADFTADNVMRHIAAKTRLDPIESFLYRQAVPLVRNTLLERRQQLSFLADIPAAGPGRVDTFDPYKSIQFDLPYDGSIGTADLPSLWNQAPRVGMHLHWDGNNTSVFERNISASLGAGATPDSLDMPRMLAVADWIGSPDPKAELDDETRAKLIEEARNNPVPAADELQIPAFPFAIDKAKARQGEEIYQQECAACHDWHGDKIGLVTPIDQIGTDPERLDSFTPEFVKYQNTLGKGYWWQFHNFQKTNGYANLPLDGLWARAPYLHNGSVPTLSDLLKTPSMRPQHFYRADDEYDPYQMGFRSDRPTSADGRPLFLYDTTLPGNGNQGHLYGTDLSESDKEALLEFLKTP